MIEQSDETKMQPSVMAPDNGLLIG